MRLVTFVFLLVVQPILWLLVASGVCILPMYFVLAFVRGFALVYSLPEKPKVKMSDFGGLVSKAFSSLGKDQVVAVVEPVENSLSDAVKFPGRGFISWPLVVGILVFMPLIMLVILAALLLSPLYFAVQVYRAVRMVLKKRIAYLQYWDREDERVDFREMIRVAFAGLK